MSDVDTMERVKKEKKLDLGKALPSKDEQSIALKKLVSQVTSDINEWTERDTTKRGGFDFTGRISYALDKNNRERYYLINAEVPVGVISASFDNGILNVLIYPTGNQDKKYLTLFTYCGTKRDNIKKYAMVYFDRKDKEVLVQVSTKELR
jgi:hypothetical protein